MTGLNVDDPISQAPKIRIPVLVFSTDGALIPEQAKKFHDRVKTEKQLVWSTGYHFNFCDVFPEMMQAVDAVVPFMRKTFWRRKRSRVQPGILHEPLWRQFSNLNSSEVSEPEGHPVTGRKIVPAAGCVTQLGLFRGMVKCDFKLSSGAAARRLQLVPQPAHACVHGACMPPSNRVFLAAGSCAPAQSVDRGCAPQ
jgi:hypothetical protein